ncbi:MAG: hypothetical protein K6A43_07335 [Treponema sp.]|nr:hypothetical protein [Treponema sp.]
MGRAPENQSENDDNSQRLSGTTFDGDVSENPAFSDSENLEDSNLEFQRFLQELWALEDNEEAQDELLFEALNELEPVFEAKDENQFSKIIKKYSKQSIYPVVEDYSKKQINRLIIDNEIGFVLAALYTLIDTNIDASFEDEEAIEMYYTIYESYALQKRAKSVR